MPTPPKPKIIDRQALASEAIDLVLTKLVRQLKAPGEVTPALMLIGERSCVFAMSDTSTFGQLATR